MICFMVSKSEILTTLFLIVCSFSYSQTESFIEKKLNQCLLDSAGEYGRQACIKQATAEWVKMQDLLNKKIFEELPLNQRKHFIETQNAWQTYYLKNLEFWGLMNKQESNALMLGTLYENYKLELVRARALELKIIYNRLSK